MNARILSPSGGALWSSGEHRSGEYRTMATAVAIGIVVEIILLFSAVTIHFSDSVTEPAPTPMRTVMRAELVKIDMPPPPPAPIPEIKQIIKHQSIIPHPTPQPTPQKSEPVAAPMIPVAATPAPSAPAVATTTNNVEPQAAAPSPASSSTGPVVIGLVCPVQSKPDMPKRAEAEGIVGSVVARATISAGKVVHVDIVRSQPAGIFDDAVRRAMFHYQCDSNAAGTVVAEQSFNFMLSD